MPDFPGVSMENALSVLSTWDPRLSSLADAAIGTRASLASAVYTSASRAYYYPIEVNDFVTVTMMALFNGATVSGNVDVGIYDVNGKRLVSAGSTAQAGASTIQTFDVTDTALEPGDYYLAMACDNITATFFCYKPNAQIMEAFGTWMQATAIPLPATATFATASSGFVPFLAALANGTVF
jgi:hypothetical protein